MIYFLKVWTNSTDLSGMFICTISYGFCVSWNLPAREFTVTFLNLLSLLCYVIISSKSKPNFQFFFFFVAISFTTRRSKVIFWHGKIITKLYHSMSLQNFCATENYHFFYIHIFRRNKKHVKEGKCRKLPWTSKSSFVYESG